MSDAITVGIAVPVHGMVQPMFAYDLARMMSYFSAQAHGSDKVDAFGLNFAVNTYIHKARQQLAEEMLSAGVDVILWLDADMRFPVDTLSRLLAHGEPFVGANYVTRSHVPPKFTAISTDGLTRVPTMPDSEGLEEVGSLGFGCVLTHASVFAALPPPLSEGYWFWYAHDPETGAHTGEDVYFCNLAREHGATVMLDHDLSNDVRHIGSIEFAPDHATVFMEQPNIEVLK